MATHAGSRAAARIAYGKMTAMSYRVVKTEETENYDHCDKHMAMPYEEIMAAINGEDNQNNVWRIEMAKPVMA